jgi:hypothetical protein
MHLSSGDSGIITPIDQYDSICAHRTLGNWLSTNLQMNTAYSKLVFHASSYTRSIAAGFMTILTDTRGQAYGHTPCSFHAKGYGLLANLRLIFHVLVFFELPFTMPPLTIVSDSAGLLQSISADLSMKYLKPRKFLSSEIDLEMQIVDTLRLLESDTSFSHVKGHQDDSVDPTELPWHTQLNIRYNTIATETLATVELVPTVPFLPASELSLSIEKTNLTHHVPSQIR